MEREAVIAVGIGMMFFAGGAAVMSVMFDWLPDTLFVTIDPGKDFVSTTIQGRLGGNLHVWFGTIEDERIHFMILSHDQYDRFLSGRSPVAIYEVDGATGEFSFEPGDRGYHLVFERLEGSRTAALEIAYQISVTGIITSYAVFSTALAAVGFVILFLSVFRKQAGGARAQL